MAASPEPSQDYCRAGVWKRRVRKSSWMWVQWQAPHVKAEIRSMSICFPLRPDSRHQPGRSCGDDCAFTSTRQNTQFDHQGFRQIDSPDL